jgi:hypothetical protein
MTATAPSIETVALAPHGSNINRARTWLSDGREILVQRLR